ncbi:Isopenicillin N epimerase component 2 [Neolecta irregularis DAH-3]|uniref:Isopenicillin N epimerase component 2 n=1 Tax=Neolecta irregularis (strain DAH-3) TaxID=1198029 RepID=A0A1U7LPA4_NEOID|nr:Isopenicillin N epimerase component 2 [Neolecta irregularis DAH-3]|eukprot:OLL24458.1 Isopenicillin N epimerase component 2 [Neolecta irregularis DAH-3]
MDLPSPLKGVRVLELAGLAPAPFAGLILSDHGAKVLRIDRPNQPSTDQLCRGKKAIELDLKSQEGRLKFLDLVRLADVLIDPYRPCVLEKMDLGPQSLLDLNSRLVVARLTGFQRTGKYKDMAGHDINYIAISGSLSLFGTPGSPPRHPANILGDFAGGGAMCALGIILALYQRTTTGKGQIVESDMVSGSAYLSLFPRLALNTPLWNGPRGTNVLDGGAPFYRSYETRDGKGALEPQFYKHFVHGLGLSWDNIPDRGRKSNWSALHRIFAERISQKTLAEWETVFHGTDACVTPVLELKDLPVADKPFIMSASRTANQRFKGVLSVVDYGEGISWWLRGNSRL